MNTYEIFLENHEEDKIFEGNKIRFRNNETEENEEWLITGKIHEIVSNFQEIANSQKHENVNFDESQFDIDYNLRFEFAKTLHRNKNETPSIDIAILMYLYEILQFTSCNTFSIFGGCLRDIVDGVSPKDWDITFQSVVRMQNFIEFLTSPWVATSTRDFARYSHKYRKFENFDKMCQKLISIVPKQLYSNEKSLSFEYEIEIVFLGKKIVLNLVHYNGIKFYPADFTVNTLACGFRGTLGSKNPYLKIENIFDDIDEKNLYFNDPDMEDYCTGKKTPPEILAQYVKKILEIRIPKMKNKGYTINI